MQAHPEETKKRSAAACAGCLAALPGACPTLEFLDRSHSRAKEASNCPVRLTSAQAVGRNDLNEF